MSACRNPQRVAGPQSGRIHVLTGDRAGGDGVDRLYRVRRRCRHPRGSGPPHVAPPAVVVPALRRDGRSRHRDDRRCRCRRTAAASAAGARYSDATTTVPLPTSTTRASGAHPAAAMRAFRTVRLHPWPPRPPGFLRSGQQAGVVLAHLATDCRATAPGPARRSRPGPHPAHTAQHPTDREASTQMRERPHSVVGSTDVDRSTAQSSPVPGAALPGVTRRPVCFELVQQRRVVVSGMGGELGSLVAARLEEESVGRAARRHRRRPAAAPPAASRVPPGRSTEPPADRRADHADRSPRGHPLRGVRAERPGDAGRGGGVEHGRGAQRARRGRRVPVARRDRGALRDRGVRAGEGCAEPARRAELRSPRRLRSAVSSPRSNASPATSARCATYRSRSCGSRRCSGRTYRARSAGCCACRRSRTTSLADPPFAVIDDRDAAIATAAAARLRHDGPLNIVAAGATTVRHAARRGNRFTVPAHRPAVDRRPRCHTSARCADPRSRVGAARSRPARRWIARRQRARRGAGLDHAAGDRRAVRLDVGLALPSPRAPDPQERRVMARAGATIETPDGPAELPKEHGVVVSFPASHMDLDVDDWGRDVHAVRRAARLAAVSVGTDPRRPRRTFGIDGPAVLVCNTRHLALSPLARDLVRRSGARPSGALRRRSPTSRRSGRCCAGWAACSATRTRSTSRSPPVRSWCIGTAPPATPGAPG